MQEKLENEEAIVAIICQNFVHIDFEFQLNLNSGLS